MDKWLKSSIRAEGGYNFEGLASQSEGYVGAEIESCVIDAMHTAFDDGARAVTQTDLLQAAANMVPLSTTMGPQIAAVRKFLRGKAKAASAEEVVQNGGEAEVRFANMMDFSLDGGGGGGGADSGAN